MRIIFEISRESFRKLRKLLNFRNVNQWTENRRKRESGMEIFENLVYLARLYSFSWIPEHIPYWKNSQNSKKGTFDRLESYTSHHLQLRCINEDSVKCKTTYLYPEKRILFNSLWQRAAFKYWFEAATKGHPGSCLAVGEGVSSGLYVDRNCPLGIV